MKGTNRGSQVLVVDDTPQNLQLLGKLLRDEGYRIIVAQSGRQALEAVKKVVPDLILLDVMMPEMDGFETCTRLKEIPVTRDIPVIFLTARTETESVVKGLRLGAVDYVTKPFSAEELLVRVETHLTLQRLRKELEQRVEDVSRLRREQEAFLRHELKNRLTPIQGYAQILAEIRAEGLDRTQLDLARTVFESTKELVKLIDALKGIHDLESGNRVLEKNPLDLETLIESVIRDLETVYGDRARVLYESAAGDGTVRGDSTLLAGVFQNLIKNAIEHVADLKDDSERTVKVQLHEEDRYAVVEIANRGEAIAPEKLCTFFEKFNTDRSKKAGGTGLGTTYAYWVTRAHDGEMTVTSDGVEGTTVTVKLRKS